MDTNNIPLFHTIYKEKFEEIKKLGNEPRQIFIEVYITILTILLNI